MIRRWLLLPPAVLTMAGAPAASEREVDATLHRIYDPYAKPTYFETDWERPLFSRAAKQLIRKWQAHIGKSLTI